MNTAEVIIAAIFAALVVLAVRRVIKRGACEGCAACKCGCGCCSDKPSNR